MSRLLRVKKLMVIIALWAWLIVIAAFFTHEVYSPITLDERIKTWISKNYKN